MTFTALAETMRVRLRITSLRAKLQAAVILLMSLVVLFTALTFLISTRVTETQILRGQMESDAQKVLGALYTRMDGLSTAASVLTQDPAVVSVVNSKDEVGLETLNARAVAVRDRFQAGVIQIYDVDGVARSNLLRASLYRESSLLAQVDQGHVVIREVEGKIVMLSRADLAEGQGAVIAGVDLEQEIRDIASRYRLATDIGIEIANIEESSHPHRISTRKDNNFPYERGFGHSRDVYTERMQVELGDDTVDIILALSTQSTRRLTRTGLLVTFLSLVTTTGVLLFGSLMLMRAFAIPVRELSEAANAVAQGDLDRHATTMSHSFLKVGQDDELGALTTSFNRMVLQLQDLYNHLEARVEDRTRELATAAEVARTVASSLDLHVILHEACYLIQQRLKADIVAVYIIDPDHSTATLEYVQGHAYPLVKGNTVVLDSHTTIGVAARHHSPCLVPDTATTTRYLPTTWSAQTRSVVTIPILLGRDPIGVLDLQSSRPGHFTTELVHLLNTLSDQIALGIQNAQRYADEQRHRRFTEVLELTGRILSGSHSLQELPKRALSSLNALVDYERGSLWMVEGKRVVPLAQYGYTDERPLLRQHVTVDTDLYVTLASERQPLIINDLATVSELRSDRTTAHQRLWDKEDRAWMGVPIVATKGQVIGLICLASSEVNAFGADDAVWVQAFASQAGLALENAQLYAELEEAKNAGSNPEDATAFCERKQRLQHLQIEPNPSA